VRPEYGAFLRGINVGTAHRVGSADLRACFEGVGLTNVATFRTSGNVAFDGEGASPGDLRARIEEALEGMLGYDVSVFLRTADEVRAIAAQDPFTPAQAEGSKGKLQVMMFAGKPATGARKTVLALATDEDALAFGDRELYWLPSGGMSDSKLDLKAIWSVLGTNTIRTKGTVDRMAAKFFAE
jgi:uncharacterized protein (DUF1697 family)